MRISKSVLINSLAALVLVTAGYMLGQIFPADTATAEEVYTTTKFTGNLKMQQRDKIRMFVDGAQRWVYCGYYAGCTAGGVSFPVKKLIRNSTGAIEYHVTR